MYLAVDSGNDRRTYCHAQSEDHVPVLMQHHRLQLCCEKKEDSIEVTLPSGHFGVSGVVYYQSVRKGGRGESDRGWQGEEKADEGERGGEKKEEEGERRRG